MSFGQVTGALSGSFLEPGAIWRRQWGQFQRPLFQRRVRTQVIFRSLLASSDPHISSYRLYSNFALFSDGPLSVVHSLRAGFGLRGLGLLLHRVLLLLLDRVKELLARLLEVEARLLQPGVRPNLVHARALLGVVAEQGQNEVLELRGQVLTIDFLEVELRLASHEQVVEVLLLARLFEGEYSVDNNK